MTSGRESRSEPVVQMLHGDRVIRYERLSNGRLRRLVEDERGVFSPPSTGYKLIEPDFAQLEMRFAAWLGLP